MPKAKGKFKKGDRIEFAIQRGEDVFAHRGTVTYAGYRKVWFLLDHVVPRVARILHEDSPALRKLSLLERIAEAAA
jgi:hypothetical protein